MSKGIIGRPYTFTVLWVDETGTPFDVNNPTVEVFYWDEAGDKVTLVPAATVLPKSVPAEIGRYAFTITIPDSLDPSRMIYGTMRGEDPVSGKDLVVEDLVDLFTEGSMNSSSGLTASFIKPGVC